MPRNHRYQPRFRVSSKDNGSERRLDSTKHHKKAFAHRKQQTVQAIMMHTLGPSHSVPPVGPAIASLLRKLEGKTWKMENPATTLALPPRNFSNFVTTPIFPALY
mmetsp:Transcript_80008/g.133628  ORF Transcript_80008/g.133628 Transcript_80008/m.133628 type:complete len:105 (+) Transcript_80008:88-402(+)